MPFNRESLAARRNATVTVAVPGHGDYLIRALSVAEANQWQTLNKAAGDGSSMPIMLALSLVDDGGSPLFKAEDWQEVTNLVSFHAAGEIWLACLKINGLESKPVAEQGSDLKNSDATPT